jgi:hypothetical protein
MKKFIIKIVQLVRRPMSSISLKLWDIETSIVKNKRFTSIFIFYSIFKYLRNLMIILKDKKIFKIYKLIVFFMSTFNIIFWASIIIFFGN